MKFDEIDKIYFLHLSDRYDREKWMRSQIEKMNFPEDKVNIWWTCRRNISNDIAKYIPTLYSSDYKLYENENSGIWGGAFNCTFEHYSIIRTSYERGFNYILVFEDDVKFMVDLDIFKKIIELLPDDFNICCFHYNFWDEAGLSKISSNYKEIPTLETQITNPYYIYNNYGVIKYAKMACSTCAYILDRQGMKNMIDYYNQCFCVADQIFANLKNSLVYHCNYQLVTTQDWQCPPKDYLWSELWKLNTGDHWNQFK